MSTATTKLLRFGRLGAVMLSVILSLYVGFFAQASCPDYRGLLLSILPFAVADAAIVVFIFASEERGKMWIAGVPAVLGFASYLEMACRVLLGFRLL